MELGGVRIYLGHLFPELGIFRMFLPKARPLTAPELGHPPGIYSGPGFAIPGTWIHREIVFYTCGLGGSAPDPRMSPNVPHAPTYRPCLALFRAGYLCIRTCQTSRMSNVAVLWLVSNIIFRSLGRTRASVIAWLEICRSRASPRGFWETTTPQTRGC